MNIKTFITYLFLSFITASYATISTAQTVVQGTVTDEKGQGTSYVSVVLRQLPDSTISSYCYSDNDGRYQLTYKGTSKRLLVSISGIGIIHKYKEIDNRSQTVNFRAVEEAIKLREVVVQSKRIWGAKDTINYLVSSFSDKNDVVIGDVLKKMPGITVEDDGGIKYRGKPINKFYIENMDLLQGRYGIATNNISAKDVSTVQVLENHQPVKALEKIRISNDAAINLKLKDSVKGVLSIMAQLGIGASPLLWENQLTGMYFAKKHQSIVGYKSNNSGLDLSKELRSFTARNAFENENILGVSMPSPPSIDQQRYLFNNSNAVTVNNVFKTKDDNELNFNLYFLNDHENRESSARTSYYLPGQDVLVIDEDMASSRNQDRLETELRYNRNNSNNYLNNYLNAEGTWDNSLGAVFSKDAITQRLKKFTFRINNSFQWVKNTGDERGFELTSNTGFRSTPQTLSVYPGQYADIFNGGNPYTMLRQQARFNSFYLNNRMTLLSPLMVGSIRISPTAEANLEARNLYSKVYTQGEQGGALAVNRADSMNNDINWLKYTTGVGVGLKYGALRNLRLEVSLPVYYQGICFDNRVRADKNNISRFFFQPSAILSYGFSDAVNLDANYGFYHATGSLQSMYTGYILQNYRSLNRYDGNLAELQGNGGSIGLSYKDLGSMLFARGNINYNYTESNMMYGQNFKGILSITSAIEQPNSQQGVSMGGNISKGFDWKNTLVTLEANYGINSSEVLRQNKLVDYKTHGLNITGIVSGRASSFLSFSTKGIWGRYDSKMDMEKAPTIKSFVNQTSMDINLPKDITVNLNYEYYYNNTSMGDKHLSFTDLGLSYTWKRISYKLFWNNIFDTNQYVSAYYGDLNTYQQIYQIRPSNIMLRVSFKLR